MNLLPIRLVSPWVIPALFAYKSLKRLLTVGKGRALGRVSKYRKKKRGLFKDCVSDTHYFECKFKIIKNFEAWVFLFCVIFRRLD